MTTVEAPPCANHPDRLAVAEIRSDGDLQRFVCEVCADRFWQLAHVTGSAAATLTYLGGWPGAVSGRTS